MSKRQRTTRSSPRRSWIRALVAGSLLAAAPLPALSQLTTIRTYQTPTGGGTGVAVNVPSPVLPLQVVGAGQTFITPVGQPSLLLDFSFWFLQAKSLGSPVHEGRVPFVTQIYEWDPSGQAVGPALFTSPVTISPPLNGPLTWIQYTFPTGHLPLQSNTAYLALVTVLGVPNDGVPRLFTMNDAATGVDPYPPGLRVTQYVDVNTGQRVWASLPEDYLFEAHLLAAPEPASGGLVAAGVVAGVVAGAVRRRRERA